eukprot:COSAG02_NODE_3191_length_7197_cov_28.589321_1_plen_106_part_00
MRERASHRRQRAHGRTDGPARVYVQAHADQFPARLELVAHCAAAARGEGARNGKLLQRAACSVQGEGRKGDPKDDVEWLGGADEGRGRRAGGVSGSPARESYMYY